VREGSVDSASATYSRHPEVLAAKRRASKDRPQALGAHPSRLALKKGEHLRMTAEYVASD